MCKFLKQSRRSKGKREHKLLLIVFADWETIRDESSAYMFIYRDFSMNITKQALVYRRVIHKNQIFTFVKISHRETKLNGSINLLACSNIWLSDVCSDGGSEYDDVLTESASLGSSQSLHNSPKGQCPQLNSSVSS